MRAPRPQFCPFPALDFHSSTVLLSAPNRCRRTDDDAPIKGLCKAISLFVRQRMQKVDRRKRILDYARKDEFGEGSYGKASVGRGGHFCVCGGVWVVISLPG